MIWMPSLLPATKALLLVATVFLLGLLPTVQSSSIRRPGSSSSRRPAKSSTSSSLPEHCKPNKFVNASPLAVGAVCRDGVALLAVHTSPALEPLLLPREGEADEVDDELVVADDSSGGDEDSTSNDEQQDSKSSAAPTLLDLPRSHRGPFRISPIDSHGTALLTAGWRSDCVALAAKCRDVAATEAAEYGVGNTGTDGCARSILGKDYGRGIATEAGLWLAQCSISGDIRAMSCVGLLASCANVSNGTVRDKDNTSSNTRKNPGGYLYLIDSSGVIHRARAFAIGNGANYINKRLVQVDFTNLSKEEATRKLTDIIIEEGMMVGEGKHDNWRLPAQTRIEMAVLDSSRWTLRRLRRQMLFEQ